MRRSILLGITTVLIVTPIFAQSDTANKQKAAASTISASVDKTGQHPGTAPIAGPATIKCISATSNIPRPQPTPSCLINAPGYNGNLNPGQSAGASGAGTVVLNCNGQGDILRCSASVR